MVNSLINFFYGFKALASFVNFDCETFLDFVEKLVTTNCDPIMCGECRHENKRDINIQDGLMFRKAWVQFLGRCHVLFIMRRSPLGPHAR